MKAYQPRRLANRQVANLLFQPELPSSPAHAAARTISIISQMKTDDDAASFATVGDFVAVKASKNHRVQRHSTIGLRRVQCQSFKNNRFQQSSTRFGVWFPRQAGAGGTWGFHPVMLQKRRMTGARAVGMTDVKGVHRFLARLLRFAPTASRGRQDFGWRLRRLQYASTSASNQPQCERCKIQGPSTISVKAGDVSG